MAIIGNIIAINTSVPKTFIIRFLLLHYSCINYSRQAICAFMYNLFNIVTLLIAFHVHQVDANAVLEDKDL